MTTCPRRIALEVQAAEPLEMVNRLRVIAFIVADTKELPVGLVHVDDLL